MKNYILDKRKHQVGIVGKKNAGIQCHKRSVAGSVSQRACVFCGSRVVLYPISDAIHIIHGPIGCAVYTWDIRGSLSSGPELHRNSFSTNLNETDIIYGGEKKLAALLDELIITYRPKAAFVYATCITGLIGDDIDAVCKKAEAIHALPVFPVHSEGFKGTKMDGYQAACKVLFDLMIRKFSSSPPKIPCSINVLGEFNLAGEAWIIKRYYESMGVKVVSILTGDGRIEDIQNAPRASLNVVQCSGSMKHLAKFMKDRYDTPFIHVSYFGIEDVSKALYDVASHFASNPKIMEQTKNLIQKEVSALSSTLKQYATSLAGKKAGVYVGGAFKAFSLVKALRYLKMQVVFVGSQTGNKDDYQKLAEICDPGTVILDDSNPIEIAKFSQEKKIDLLIGGVKERPIAYKLGFGFCDHNHERKIPLAGFEGMEHFAREVFATVMTPVWQIKPYPSFFKGEKR